MPLMRSALATFALLLILAAGTARAEPSATAAQAEIRAVIEAQLEAFQVDDEARAFSFASPMIQEKFGDPATFMRMVRTGYPMVYRPRQVRFLELAEIEGELTQLVMVVGPDGMPAIAYYLMTQQPEGSWRINGCVIQRTADEVV